MTPERFGDLLRRPQLLDGQNAIELEELLIAHPWCGPLRILRYRKAVLDGGTDVAQWRQRAGPFLPRGTRTTHEHDLRLSHPARARAHFGFADVGELGAGEPPSKTRATSADTPATAELDLPDCIPTAAAAVDTAEWYLHRNGLIMEFGRPRPAPIEQLDSYKRWKRRRVRASWNDLLLLGIEPGKAKKGGRAKKKAKKPKPVATAAAPEVASETLAELLAAQGHSSRAIDMYRQLSLRYPNKKDNFAARIAVLRREAQ